MCAPLQARPKRRTSTQRGGTGWPITWLTISRVPSRSRQSRLAKPVRSAVRPCRTTPTVRPLGSVHGQGLVRANLHGAQERQQDAPPLGRDGVGAEHLVHADALRLGQPLQVGGREMAAPRRPQQVGGVGEGRRHSPALQGGQFQPVEEGRRGQPSQGPQAPLSGAH